MECIFCKIAQGQLKSELVYEDDDVVAFNDINPQAPIHIVVIPRKHVEKIEDLRKDGLDLGGKMFLAAHKIAQDKNLAEAGYRLVLNRGKDAGQEIAHIHVHLLCGRKFAWPPG